MHNDLVNGIFNIFHNNDSSYINSLYDSDFINKHILFFIKMISTKDNEISQGYTKCFIELTDYINNNNKLKISEEVIQATLVLKKKNKSPLDKKFCVFICSQLLQIENLSNPEIINLFDFLKMEQDPLVKREIGQQIGFIAKEKDVTFFIKHFLNIILQFLDDVDMEVKTGTIISSIKNLDRVYDDNKFLNKLINVIIELLMKENMEQNHLLKTTQVVTTIFYESLENIKVAKILDKVIKLFFKVSISFSLFS